MKKWRKKQKINFFARRAKKFLFPKFFVAVLVWAGLAAIAAGYAVYEKNSALIYQELSAVSGSVNSVASTAPEPANSSMPAVTPASALAAFLGSTSSSAPIFSSLNLSYDMGVYVYSKKKHVCNDYRNIIKSNFFSMRCKVAEGIWRGHFVKKIDVAGYSKLRVKASLGVADYTDYFAECGHKGINRDDFIALMALSYDPELTFNWDCNHEVADEKWSMCQVLKTDPGVMAHCGVPMCTKNRSCDFEIDVSKKDAIYLLFSVNDAWVADIEGSLTNVEIMLIK